MNQRDDIIKKIKNLLALASNSAATPAEAAQAALFAQRFIAKYDISDAELYDNSADFDVVEVESALVYRKFKYLLGSVIADNYRCKVYFSKLGRKDKAVFMGRDIDAHAAALVYNKMYDCVNSYANSQSLQYRGYGYGLYGDAYNSAAVAFIDGIQSELEKQCKELILVCPQEVKEEFEAKTKGWKQADSSLSNSGWANYEQGFNAGRDAVRSGRIEGKEKWIE